MVKRWVKKGFAKRPTGRTRVVRRRRPFGKMVTTNDKSKYRFRIMAWTDLQSNAGATISCAFPLNAPSYYASANVTLPTPSAFAQLPHIGANEMTLLTYFDQYRVHSLKFTFVSRYCDVSNQTSVINQNCYYIYQDSDDMATSAETVAVDKGIVPYPINQGMGGRSRFPSHRFVNPEKTWYNTANFATAPSTATTSSTNLSPTFYKSLKFIYPSPTGGATYYLGRLYLTWDVEVKNII